MQEQESGEGRNAGHSTLGEPMSKQEMEMEMIAIKGIEEVEISSHEDSILISQKNPSRDDDDAILLYPEHVERFIAALLEAKDEAEQYSKGRENA